jgi:hypothetical protein
MQPCFDLFGIVKRIVDAKAQFRSLAEPWADTSARTGRADRRGPPGRRAEGATLAELACSYHSGQEHDFKGWVGFRMSDDPKENEEAPRPSVEHIQEPEREPGNVGLFHRPF